ncbi:MAG: RodZ domain-containing protein [Candidatus Omnitrophota bacterium]|jgi:hypothetical protein
MANLAENHGISMTNIGEKLREAREKKAVTIEQAQKQTHIHSTVITALEDGRCDDILAPNYVKSFLKEYANYLGLNAKELVDAYYLSRPELSVKNLNLTKPEIKASASGLSDAIRLARKIIIAIVILAFIVFLTGKAISYLKSPKSGKNVSGVKVQDVKKSSKFDITIKEIPRSSPIVLTIRVKRPVMVQLKRDGVLLFKRSLQKGSVESITANDSINISAAKAEAIEISLNGTNLGSPGKGIVKNLEITRTGARIK